ncbi:ParA family protein [Alloalcanivorax mobilis]|uniref:ParA family protein n=1 Tax=Alloalcanivorax mobilis TaxID=2019569 RepID=UPI001E49130E|nr:ParA family protein [Alloalcanivorax mobilis]
MSNNTMDPTMAPPSARRVGRHDEQRLVILVSNSKGGCGKTTLATNLAAYFAHQGQSVTLLDLDPQQSATQWVRLRADPRVESLGWPHDEPVSLGRLREQLGRAQDIVVIDSPAGMDRHTLDHVLRISQVVLVPVLPSPIDIRATTRFVQTVMLAPSYQRRPRRLAVIANRARTRTLMYEALRQFLSSLKIPYLVTLRDTQQYVQSMSSGASMLDMNDARFQEDRQSWQRIGEWLQVQRHLIRSMPGFH